MLFQPRAFVPFQGGERPAHYREETEERNFLQATVGVCDLRSLCITTISGRDATDYLHRRLTGNIKTMTMGETRPMALLGGDGRMISDLHVLRGDADQYLLVGQPVARETLADQVERYVIMDDVKVEDITLDRAMIGIYGPVSSQLLQRLTAEAHDGSSVVVLDMSDIGVAGQALVIKNELRESWFERAANAACEMGGGACGHLAWNAVRVKNAVPLFGTDMSTSTIPLEAGLYNLIDFNKGCFPGQEVVARINNLGHPARVLVQIQGPKGTLEEGAIMEADGKSLGKVTSAASFDDADLALAWVKWDYREAGTRLVAASANDQTEVEVTKTAGTPQIV